MNGVNGVLHTPFNNNTLAQFYRGAVCKAVWMWVRKGGDEVNAMHCKGMIYSLSTTAYSVLASPPSRSPQPTSTSHHMPHPQLKAV